MPPAQILIVEDEPVLAQAIQLSLERLGYCVPAIFDSGEKVLEYIPAASIDLVIMDVILQGKLDGVQTAERIRLDRSIPIIFLTAHSDPATIKRAISTNPFGYLVKPFQTRDLQLAIELALHNYSMERKIRESEETYRSLTELSPNAILLLEPDGTIILVNPRACQLLGADDPADLVEKNAMSLILFNDHSGMLEGSPSNLVSLGNIRGKEYTVKRLDGNLIPVELSLSTVKDEQCNPTRIIAVILDISERKAAEKAILEQATRANTLARVASQINRSLDLDQVLSTVCDEVVAAFKVPGIAITLIEKDTDPVVIVASRGPLENAATPSSLPISASLFEQLWRANGPVVQIPDLAALEAILPVSHPLLQNVKSVLIASMVQGDKLIGSIIVPTIDAPRLFTEEELSLLAAIAEMAAIAISRARLFEQVIDGRLRLQALSRQLVEVQESERRRLAHELHDQIGQMLTGLQFNLEMSKGLCDQEAEKSITTSQGIIQEIISQVRELSLSLRPSLLDDMGLLACLEWHFERYTSQTGVQVKFTQNGLAEKRFPSEVEIAIFRIVQEALTNIARHARVKKAGVSIAIDGNQILLTIQDQGQGFDLKTVDSKHNGVGLDGMRERANLAGGRLEICSAPGHGTTIEACIPSQKRLERRKNDRNRAAGR